MEDISKIAKGLSSSDEDKKWQAAVEAGDLVFNQPCQAWMIARAFGSSDDQDTRTAIATCVLEHLLEHHFKTYFPFLESEIRAGNARLGDTFRSCWKCGESEYPENAAMWDQLRAWIDSSKHI